MENLDKEILPDIKNIKSQETYTLPSKGLVYDPADNIPASITLRRMTTKEDKIRLRNESEDRVRKDILQACIVEDIDAGKLKLMDANLLLFRLRSISLLNDKYKVYCRCPQCRTEFIHEVNLNEVPIKFMDQNNLEKLHVKLPISENIIDLKYPSINDMIKMGDKIKDYAKNFPDADINEYIYFISGTLYLDKVNNAHLMEEELDAYFNQLDILDNRAFRTAIQSLDDLFGFVDEIVGVCPMCRADVLHGLPITSELFTPSN